MKSFQLIFISSLLVFCIFSCKHKINPQNGIELPSKVGNNQIIEHYAFTLSYNEEHEQADWVAYELTKEEAISEKYDRTDNYRPDFDVESSSAELADYEQTNSTYARGHLAPAGDFKWSETGMSESFLLSNISPQIHAFNEGKWMWLENEVRHWAEIYDGIYIVTGGVLEENLPTIGLNKISVPARFYKIILDLAGEKGIAFILPNIDIEDSFKNYAVSINEAEKITGIDFFPLLDDKLEEKIESVIDLSKWSFNYYK